MISPRKGPGSGSAMQQTMTTWPCPGCGRPVDLAGAAGAGAVAPPAELDRLAQALCGCYVLSLGPSSLGRLFCALLTVDEHALEEDVFDP